MTKVVWNAVPRNPVRRHRNLFNEFDRLFERSALAHRPLPYRMAENWSLALDVAETEDGYIVKASVPGINPDDLEITLEDNVLTVKGEVENNEEIEKEQYHLRERRYGSFSRSIKFPVLVNGDDVAASYNQGVLTLDVPKAEEVKPKRIAINVN
ncbi:MAG: Hsp20/alpha crystallin family protein [Chloroflexi bacterium]|nr:Hsp20/alpha crystallin family protein [Chloroflexota bacterium]